MSDVAERCGSRVHADGWVADYKATMACLPTGVSLAVARVGDAAIAVTVGSLGSVSLEPPIVQISLKNNSRFLEQLLRQTSFSMYVLADDQGDCANHFARHPATEVPAQTLERATAVIHCTMDEAVRKGDHTLVFGLVDQFEYRDRRPLVYYKAQFWNVT
jgi:3-hydroxy-9,10-secoandrosta-1,3,5(10)-triene-9,17-dione monooxygenase reductase component